MIMTMIFMLTITHIVIGEYKFECIDLTLVSFNIVIDLLESIIIILQQLHNTMIMIIFIFIIIILVIVIILY